MSRIRCHTAMRWLAVPVRILAIPVALAINIANVLVYIAMVCFAFTVGPIVSMLPERVTARAVASEFGLLVGAMAMTVVAWALTVFVFA